jgi:hypothetical protein
MSFVTAWALIACVMATPVVVLLVVLTILNHDGDDT